MTTIPLPQLTTATLPPPRHDASRCAAGAPGEDGCRVCVDNCPYGAMQFLEQPGGRTVHIEPGMCARCGACTGLCPTSALERAFTSDDELLAAIAEQVSRTSGSALVITCSASAARIQDAFAGACAPAIVEISSILILNEIHLIHALQRFNRVAVVGCENCHHGSTHLLAPSIDRAMQLTGRAGDLVYVDDDRSQGYEALLRRYLANGCGCGNCAAKLWSVSADSGPSPAGQQTSAARRSRLFALLRQCDGVEAGPAQAIEDPAFGQVELVDEGACTMCGACTRACPTDALRIDDGALSFSHVHCVNCQLCHQACPEKIVRVQPGLTIGAGMLRRKTLVEDEMVPCRGCGRPHMPRRLRSRVRQLLDEAHGSLAAATEQVDLCSDCRFTELDRISQASEQAEAATHATANSEPTRPRSERIPQRGRRSWLQGAATIALTAFGKPIFGREQARGEPNREPLISAKRLGMVIDIDRCIGCHACTAICKAENHVPLGVFRDWVEEHVVGEYPHAMPKFLPKLCNHCDDPGCLRACPTGAIHMRPDGIVDLNHDICIGCRACNQACPYGATFMDPVRGTADKCNFCAHRIDEGLNPACVDICPTGCRIFGDLEDPNSPASQAMRGQSYQELRPELGMGPNVKYLNLPGQLDR